MTKRMPTAQARKDFAAALRASERGHRVKVTRYDKTIAVLIPKKDLERLQDCEQKPSGTPKKSRRRQTLH